MDADRGRTVRNPYSVSGADRIESRYLMAATLPVSQIFIHHEGANQPSDDVQRFARGGYTIGIGVTKYEVFRDPTTDFSTIHHNHNSIGICFSGNRSVYRVTDNDLKLLTLACADIRGRNWAIPASGINKHSDVFNTACPGSNTDARWFGVVSAVQNGLYPHQENDVPEFAIVYPPKKLPTGPCQGRQPTCLGMVGTPLLYILDSATVNALKSKYGDPVEIPLAMWLPNNVDNHVYTDFISLT